MKNNFLNSIILFLLIGCSSLNTKYEEGEIYVVYHSKYYINSILEGEKYYNSKTGLYKIYQKAPNFYKELNIPLSQEDIKTINSKYKELKIPNKKFCMKMEKGKDVSINGDILIEDIILINSYKTEEINECATKEIDQGNMYTIISMLINIIKTKQEYKNEFPLSDVEY